MGITLICSLIGLSVSLWLLHLATTADDTDPDKTKALLVSSVGCILWGLAFLLTLDKFLRS